MFTKTYLTLIKGFLHGIELVILEEESQWSTAHSYREWGHGYCLNVSNCTFGMHEWVVGHINTTFLSHVSTYVEIVRCPWKEFQDDVTTNNAIVMFIN